MKKLILLTLLLLPLITFSQAILGSDIDGEAVSDYSGRSVSMDNDGSHVAIGAIYNEGNGSGSGHGHVWAPYGIIVINPDNLTATSLTTSGATTAGSLTVDSVVIDGTTIGHSSDSDLMTLASGSLTVAGDVTISSDARLKSNIVALGPVLINALKELESETSTLESQMSEFEKIIPALIEQANQNKK